MTASLHKLTAGDGYTYLTSQVARDDATELGGQPLAEYYSAKGESPGRWRGSGLTGLGRLIEGSQVTEAHMRALFGEGRHPLADELSKEAAATAVKAGRTAKQVETAALQASALGARYAEYSPEPTDFVVRVTRAYRDYNKAHGLPRATALPPEARAEIRSRVGRETFEETFGRAPLDARELAAHVARMSRPPRQPVAGYDITFSPVKSVSTLWALAPREVAEEIERAHQAAVRDAMDWVEREVTYTRRGKAGVRQVDVRGLLMAEFVHRDSRAGDPDLHTHVAVSNKVQAEDGKWLALDGQPLHQALVAASERYNTRLEAEVTDRLGVSFVKRARPGDEDKRSVREIDGVSAALMDAWSSRRAQIDQRRAELAAEFLAAHGRPPTPKEAIQLAQQATLETRENKHEPRSLAEQRAAWRAQAEAVLGGAEAVDAMVSTARSLQAAEPTELSRADIEDLASTVVRTVEDSRARWQTAHIRAEAERRVRGRRIPVQCLDEVVGEVVAAALGPERAIPLAPPDPVEVPPELCRRDGQSQYTRAGTQLYTSERVLAAEARLIAAAQRQDGRVVPESDVGIALLESAANGTALNPAQAQMVTEMATSGARLQVGLAPAGSGKTTAMKALTRAWEGSGGRVIGLAPTAVAAAELASSIDARTDTLAKLAWHLVHGGGPDWIRSIDADTLLLIDEAGMASTPTLDVAVEYVTARGGSVRLIGDDQQLAAIGAGGVLRDIATEVGAVTLSELHRFQSVAEGEATLALREGDSAALGFYLDHERVHVTADPETLAEDVLRSWRQDIGAGKSSLMLAHTRATVDALNAKARAHLTKNGTVDTAAEVTLRSGVRAGAGDVIVTRRNDRTQLLTSTHWVKNGDRWSVTDVHPDGSITTRHHGTDRRLRMPASYVREHVDLGYATTYHGAQGATVDTTHCAITGSESRQLLYVGMSRGRLANSVYVPVSGDGDPHAAITPDVLSPRTAVDVLERVLARDASPRSARAAIRDGLDPFSRLRDQSRRYLDAVDIAAQVQVGAMRVQAFSDAAEAIHHGITSAPAWDTLLGHLCRIEADGGDGIAQMRAVARRELDTALDPAAVLDWRLDPAHARSPEGPLPWLPAVPGHLDRADWRAFTATLSEAVSDAAGALREHVLAAEAESLPGWAHGLHADRPLIADLAAWRASTGVEDEELDPVGPPHPAQSWRRRQDQLLERVAAVRGRPQAPAERWRQRLHDLDPRLLDDPYWSVLAERLDLAAAGGMDVSTLLADAHASKPLPDDHPAAALWSRLTHALDPAAAMTATAGSGATRLRPPWCRVLADQVGADLAATVMADPHWPGLVAAVHAASLAGHQPEEVVRAAVSLIDLTAVGTEHGIPREGLTTVLTWRVREVLEADSASIGDQEPPSEDEHVDTEVEELLRQWAREHDNAQPVPPPAGDAAPPEGEEPVPEAELPLTAPSRILQLNRLAAEFFKEHMIPAVDQYVTSRVGANARGRYAFGYAPLEWDGLARHLAAIAGARPEELVDAGLAKWSRRGTLIDVFRDRLMLPLHDEVGDVVGFVGRSAPGSEHGPKYLNTPTTPVFEKGRILFGLHEHAEAFAAGAQPARAEGFLDAIALTEAGAGRVAGVAPLGTALTPVQADIIMSVANEGSVLLAPDDDPAGRMAAERDYWTLTERGAQVGVVSMPEGADPAQVWQSDPALLRRLLVADPGSMPRLIVETRLTELRDDLAHGWAEARVQAGRAVAPVIASSPIDQWESLVDLASGRLGPDSADLVWRHVIAAAMTWDPLVDVTDRPDIAEDTITAARLELADLAAELEAATPSTSAAARAAQTAAIGELAVALAEQTADVEERRRRDEERREGKSRGPFPRPDERSSTPRRQR